MFNSSAFEPNLFARLQQRQIVLIAPPGGRRARAFQASLARYGLPAAQQISYLEILNGSLKLAKLIQPGALVRIDSSGECLQSERELIKLGLAELEAGYQHVIDPDNYPLEQGRLMPSRQWYLGLRAFFRLLKQELAQAAPHQLTINFEEALVFFDKRQTQARWQAASLPVPPVLPEIQGFEHLLEQLRQQGHSRVFIKLAHGSGGSGAVALQLAGQRIRAISTVEMQSERGQICLYNSRQLRNYQNLNEIQNLIDSLCQHPLQIEAWIPKLTQQQRPLDLRLVVIGGRAMHTLVRLGRGPITNLHLKNERGDLGQLKARLAEQWLSVQTCAEQAMTCFPHSLYAGLDVLISPHRHQPYLLEGNAFGDYHRHVEFEGLDTFGAILRAAAAT